MKHYRLAPKSAKVTFFTLLCASTAMVAAMIMPAPALAANVKLLPEMSPSEIAADTQRSIDAQTGISLYAAPTFDPFEKDSSLAGTAALRSGPNETTIDGKLVSGGAYLDLNMIYTSASDDPYDIRGFERSVYLSGQPIDRIHQDVRTLDCASNTTTVVYEDDYYDGYGSHGYLAGLYLLLPRYRGHRGYWSGTSRRGPNASWRNWRQYGSYGYGGSRSSYGYGGNSHRHDFDGSGRTRTRGNDRTRNGTRGNETRGNNTRSNDTRGDNTTRTGTTRSTSRGATRRDNAIIGGSAKRREFRNQRDVVTGGPLQTSDRRNPERSRTRTNNTRTLNTGRNTGRNTGVSRALASSSTPAPIAQQASPTPIAQQPTRQSTRQQTRQSTRQAAPSSRNETKSNTKSNSKSRSRGGLKPSTKSRSRNVDRAVDRSFSKNRRSRGKQLNFFPPNVFAAQTSYGLSSYAASSRTQQTFRCVREESVTLHIPQERLDAARFDGLTLVIVDNEDRDIPVYLPPNYVEGFRQAASGILSTSSYSEPQEYDSYGSTTVVTPQSSGAVQYGYPQH